MMLDWSLEATDTLSATAAKWKLTNLAALTLPKSRVSLTGTMVRAQERCVRPKTSSRMAPMVIRVWEYPDRESVRLMEMDPGGSRASLGWTV